MQLNRMILALCAAGVCATPAYAAKDADRIAQLEKQLKMMQEELAAMKQASASSKDVAELREEVKKSSTTTQEVAELRNQVEAQQKENVVVGDIPNSFRVPGSDVSVRVYGIAELNMTHDFKGSNGNNDYATFAPYVPLRGSAAADKTGQTYMHGRTSRIGIEGATPTSFGMVTAKIEGDFNNDPRTGNSAYYGTLENIYTQQGTNSYNFRLRHAYVQAGSWLIGQTWSTFMDIDNTPETVDFNGPIGSTFIRQPMIRYTYMTPQYGNFTAALENSVSYVLDPTGVATTAGFSKSPDVIVRWDKAFTWGSLSLRGVSHDLRLEGDVCTGVFDQDGQCINQDVSESTRGWGLAASGQIKTVGDDFISWIVTGGDGIGRYFNYIEGAGYNTTNNRIDKEKAAGVVLGYQHKPNASWRFNLVGGYQRHFDSEYTDWARANGLGSDQYGVNRKVYQVHLGGFWNPTKVMEVGAEYIIGQRETLDGEKGDLSRLNFLGRYNFN